MDSHRIILKLQQEESKHSDDHFDSVMSVLSKLYHGQHVGLREYEDFKFHMTGEATVDYFIADQDGRSDEPVKDLSAVQKDLELIRAQLLEKRKIRLIKSLTSYLEQISDDHQHALGEYNQKLDDFLVENRTLPQLIEFANQMIQSFYSFGRSAHEVTGALRILCEDRKDLFKFTAPTVGRPTIQLSDTFDFLAKEITELESKAEGHKLIIINVINIITLDKVEKFKNNIPKMKKDFDELLKKIREVDVVDRLTVAAGEFKDVEPNSAKQYLDDYRNSEARALLSMRSNIAEQKDSIHERLSELRHFVADTLAKHSVSSSPGSPRDFVESLALLEHVNSTIKKIESKTLAEVAGAIAKIYTLVDEVKAAALACEKNIPEKQEKSKKISQLVVRVEDEIKKLQGKKKGACSKMSPQKKAAEVSAALGDALKGLNQIMQNKTEQLTDAFLNYQSAANSRNLTQTLGQSRGRFKNSGGLERVRKGMM